MLGCSRVFTKSGRGTMRRNTSKRWIMVGALLALAAAVAPSHAMELKLALGQIESGASKPTRCSADLKIGTRREVSRYQLLPSVWRKYSDSRDYHNPSVAWEVSERILSERYAWF